MTPVNTPVLSPEWTRPAIVTAIVENLLDMGARVLEDPTELFPLDLTDRWPGKWMSSLPTSHEQREAFVRVLRAAEVRPVVQGDVVEIAVALPATDEGRAHRWMCADVLDAVQWCLMDTPWPVPANAVITAWGGTSTAFLSW